jgi:hypothetical protein
VISFENSSGPAAAVLVFFFLSVAMTPSPSTL